MVVAMVVAMIVVKMVMVVVVGMVMVVMKMNKWWDIEEGGRGGRTMEEGRKENEGGEEI